MPHKNKAQEVLKILKDYEDGRYCHGLNPDLYNPRNKKERNKVDLAKSTIDDFAVRLLGAVKVRTKENADSSVMQRFYESLECKPNLVEAACHSFVDYMLDRYKSEGLSMLGNIGEEANRMIDCLKGIIRGETVDLTDAKYFFKSLDFRLKHPNKVWH